MPIYHRLLMPIVCLAATLGLLVRSNSELQAQSSFPFVVPGDDASSTVTDFSHLLHKPAGKFGFVEARDGHFYFRNDVSSSEVNRERFRMWGVNLCFGANFPTHEEADKIAPHLAKLGINAVRFHHADGHDAPNGIWGSYDENGVRQLSAEMVDRLDYFLAKLHELGIYADLNMHVSRQLTTREGYPVLEGAPWWAASNKYVMYYDPDVQAELKRFCKEFLNHTNPYRKLRRADDPGIAVVELLNENYFSEQGYSLVDKLPERFRRSLEKKWNQWLTQSYRNHDSLMKAWTKGDRGLGKALVPATDWKSHLDHWVISREANDLPRSFGVTAPKELQNAYALRIAPKATTEHDYQQQLLRQKIRTKQNEPMTLAFWVRADSPRKLKVEMSSLAGGEWRELGLFEELSIGPVWQHVTRVISPKESTTKDEAYLAFSFGNDKTALEFAAISLYEGSPAGKLPAAQSLAKSNISLPGADFPPLAHADMKRFMIDTERAWIRELKTYVRDLGVRVPITASQVNYHAPGIVESELDFADLHNYWHHPMFPTGKDWSATDWTVANQPMEAGPTYSKWPANSLLMRTGWRVDGMPMTLSEWNYPQPSYYSAGCVPMAAMIASLQDWDAVFFFDYEAFMFVEDKDRPFFKNKADNFFSFNGEPAKLTALSVFANLYLRGDLEPLKESLVAPPNKPINGLMAMQKRIGVRSDAKATPDVGLPDESKLQTPNKSIVWNVQKSMEQGTIQLDTDKTIGVWGTIANQSFSLRKNSWDVGTIDRNYGILIATSVDDKPIGLSQRLLLLAATHSENTNMKWNGERTSVGNQWGSGPTNVVAINAKITIPWSKSTAKVTALDGTGKPTISVPAEVLNGTVRFEIGESYKTLWYAIEAE